jgi:hypothetical protein
MKTIQNYMSLIIYVAATLIALPAQAYIGPGLGLGVAGVIVGFCIATLLLIAGLVILPLRRLLRGIRSRKKKFK